MRDRWPVLSGLGAYIATMLVLALPACDTVDPAVPELVGCLPSYADVEQVATTELARIDLQDAAVLVRVDGSVACRLFFGSYGPTTEVFTASAAKWLTAAAVLAATDRGGLRLDTRAVDLFPTTPAITADITVSQLLSHTSGLLWFSRCMGRPDDTLQECAETILHGDVHFEPGTGFFYAGPPFTVAGAMAERASGQLWADLFRTMIAVPLGMTHTSYGDNPNPALSEGNVVSSLDDYGRFAQMILDDGVWQGRRVLSEEAIRQMRHNWSAGVPIVYSPRGDIPYGLGAWLDAIDTEGDGTVISSPGIGGFVPLVDYDRRMAFVFVSLDEVDRIWPAMLAILNAARALVDQGAPAGRN